MPHLFERFRRASASRGKGGWTAVFEKDGRILYECGPSSFSGRALVVGRSRECDWCTADIDHTLSSRHAELLLRRGALVVRDLGSRNGLYFRGERVKEHRFSPGDTVLLGACKITVESAKEISRGEAPAFHRIERLNGPDAGSVLEIRDESGNGIEIGSDPECAVHCPDTLVSRKHARLVVKKDGGCWIRDEGSRNGTTVNGVPLKKDKERMLRDRDVIGIAELEFRFLEKGAVHAEVRVGRMLLVSAATVAVAVIAFSLWNLSRTGARSILARAEATARATWSTAITNDAEFAAAFVLLDAAAQARNADVYAADIRNARNTFTAWTNAICSWRAFRADLRRGLWNSAKKGYPLEPGCQWTFNAVEAPAAKRRAREAKRLLDAFLDVRKEAFEGKNWNDDIPKATEKLVGFIDRIAEALPPFVPPEGKVEPWAVGLVSEAENIIAELRLETNELRRIERALAPLAWTRQAEPAADAAARALAEIERVQEENEERGGRRRTETVSFGGGKAGRRPVPFFSSVVFHCAEGARRPLPDFAKAERIVAENVRNVARQKWGAVEGTLPLPPETVTVSREEFTSFRKWLETKNAKLCGPVLGEWRSRAEALRDKGFSPENQTASEAFGALLGADKGEILAFVPPALPAPGLSSRSGHPGFDRLFGAVRTRNCLKSLAAGCVRKEKGGVRTAQGLRDLYGKRQRALFPEWTTVVQTVLEDLDSLRGLRDLPESDDGLYGLVYDADVPPSENRCRQWVSFAKKRIEDVEDWAAEFSDRCSRSGKERDAILGDFALLLLAPGLCADGEDSAAEKLGRRFDALEDGIEAIGLAIRDSRTNGPEGSRKIVAEAFPSDSKTYTDAREEVLRAKAGGAQ